ncbi:MAG: hypothetical protein ACRCUE_09165 [Bosea sp. (in: a-proteobacteria)]
MVQPKGPAVLDPAKDSALLLQRMGFFTLGVALPVAAMVSRRAAVVLVPIGVVLLVIAAILSEPERFVRSLKRRSTRATALALITMLLWVFLSYLWAPRGAAGHERGFNMAFALVIGILGVSALPERVRATNLNALAVGTGAAAIVAAFMQASGFGLGDAEDDVTVLVRGLALVIVLTGPLVAWLLTRGRASGAAALFGSVLICSLLIRDMVLLASLCAGLATFALVFLARRKSGEFVALACALVVLAAPLLAWLSVTAQSTALSPNSTLLAGLAAWVEIIRAEPVKLLTGHGLGAVTSLATRPGSPLVLPESILIVIWHDLGLVGALAFAVALLFAMRAARALSPAIQAGAIAAYVTAFTCGLLGLAGFRAWWLMTLVAVAIITSAIGRGQARTDRPLARMVAAPRASPGRSQLPANPE